MSGLASLGLAGCSNSAAKDEPAKGAGAPPPVEVAAVRTGGLSDTWTFLGNVRSLERAELGAGAPGTVTRLEVREGDAVTAGQTLAEIDPALAQATLAGARARLAAGQEELTQLERDEARVAQLSAGVVAPAEREQIRSRLEAQRARVQSLEAEVQQALATYDRHRIRAPFAGVVARREADKGDFVQTGQVLLHLVSTGKLEILVDVPANLHGRVEVGDTARVANRDVPLVIAGIVPALDLTSRTLRVRLATTDDSTLLPGEAVSVVFDVSFDDEGVVVPRDALVMGPEGAKLVRVVDGKAEPQMVSVLATTANEALVQGDAIAAGDRVIIRGNERARPGQAVRVTGEK